MTSPLPLPNALRTMMSPASRISVPAKSACVLAAVLLIAALLGCVPHDIVEKFADASKKQIAEDYIRRLAAGDVAGLAAETEPKLQTPDLLPQLQQMHALLPKEAPTVKTLIGYHYQRDLTAPSSLYNLTYQLGYGAKWFVVNAAWREAAGGTRVIAGLQVHPLPEPLEVTHAFNFKRAGFRHYIVFAGVCVVPVFILVTLVACIRTKFARRKWLWIIFVLFGVMQLSINWTTGELAYSVLSFSLFGVAATAASPHSPWTLAFGLPLGAILFWFRRRKLAAPPQPPIPPAQEVA